MKYLKSFENMSNMKYIIENGVEYTFSERNTKGDFIWDWDEHCEIEPDEELVFEDDIGNEYVIYLKNGEKIGEFLNDD